MCTKCQQQQYIIELTIAKGLNPRFKYYLRANDNDRRANLNV